MLPPSLPLSPPPPSPLSPPPSPLLPPPPSTLHPPPSTLPLHSEIGFLIPPIFFRGRNREANHRFPIRPESGSRFGRNRETGIPISRAIRPGAGIGAAGRGFPGLTANVGLYASKKNEGQDRMGRALLDKQTNNKAAFPIQRGSASRLDHHDDGAPEHSEEAAVCLSLVPVWPASSPSSKYSRNKRPLLVS